MSEMIQGAGKSKLRRYLVIALLLTLAVTSGLFAYAYTTATATITAGAGGEDYALVTANTSFPNYTVFGKYRGALPSGYLFNIDPTTNYPGDLAVNVYLDNIDELGKNYGLWAMRIQLVDTANLTRDVEGITKVLSMRNGVVSFTSENMTPGATYHVRSTGGVYRAHPWAYISLFNSGNPINPSITCEVLQAK